MSKLQSMKRRKFPKQRHPRNGRYFFSQEQLSESRHAESVAFSEAKREGVELGGFKHIACGCGCGPFPRPLPKSKVEPIAKQPKSKRKPKPKLV